MAIFGRSPEREAEAVEARYLHFLVRAGELLGLSLDYHETLRNVCAAAVETVADICLLDLWYGSEIELVGAAHRVPGMTERLADAGKFLRSHDGYARHSVRQVIDTGEPVLIAQVDDTAIERLAKLAA